MTSYEILWDFAEDHHGIVTTEQAVAMGIDKHQLPAMAKRGTLIKKGYGVYLAKHHIHARMTFMRIPWQSPARRRISGVRPSLHC